VPEVTNKAALAKVRKARSQVVQSHPFFGVLLLKQKLVEAPNIPTMATNGRELFYNPEYVLNQSAEYLRFDCAHEALHPALGHHVRRGDRDFELWNEATDYQINPMLVEAGLHIMPDALIRDDLTGIGAEAAFKVLLAEQQGDQDGEPGDEGQPEAADQAGDQDGGGAAGDQDQDQDQDQDGDQDGDQDQDGDGDGDGEGQGQGQGDGQGDGTEQIPQGWSRGAVLDAPVDTPQEREAEEREWKTTLVQAANLAAASKDAGNLPGDLVRAIQGYVDPKASWEELLRRFMDQFARNDYSWSVPNRRFIAGGTYLPSLKSDQMPPMAFVIDASGSMPDQALQQAASELQYIVDQLQPEFVDMIVHDTEVTDVRRFEPGDPIDADNVRAGGGTAFVPVCEHLDECGEDYAVVIWFTDLYTNDLDECIEPNCPVLWIDYDPHDGKYSGGNWVPPFGEEIIELIEET